MKRLILNIVFVLCGISASFSQPISEVSFEKEKIKIERAKNIRRATKVAIGVVVCSFFEIPAIPVIAVFAISEIANDKNKEQRRDEK
jgi:hypothetical protein